MSRCTCLGGYHFSGRGTGKGVLIYWGSYFFYMKIKWAFLKFRTVRYLGAQIYLLMTMGHINNVCSNPGGTDLENGYGDVWP